MMQSSAMVVMDQYFRINEHALKRYSIVQNDDYDRRIYIKYFYYLVHQRLIHSIGQMNS